MSISAATSPGPSDTLTTEFREKLRATGLEPLWDSAYSHKVDGAIDNGHAWRWRDMREIMLVVAESTSPKIVERRVLSLLDPRSRYRAGEGTVGSLNGAMQLLKPGEQARPHRHSMNALRFVLESSGGAKTVVDGHDCPMEQFDLVLTPAWCWHAHVHNGSAPVIWLDILDVALHRFLGTEHFQPGPAGVVPPQWPQNAVPAPGFIPVFDHEEREYSPIFRYPWSDAVAALEAAPPRADGTRMVRYVNPLTGGAGLTLIDSALLQIEAGTTTQQETVIADQIFCVLEGSGSARIGSESRLWSAKDIFTVPVGRPLRLAADSQGSARLAIFANTPVFQRLGLASSRKE